MYNQELQDLEEEDVFIPPDIGLIIEESGDPEITGTINLDESNQSPENKSSDETRNEIEHTNIISIEPMVSFQNEGLGSISQPEVFIEVGSNSPTDDKLGEEANEEKKRVCKRKYFFICLCATGFCFCCVCCLCILVIFLAISSGAIASFFFYCVTGNESTETRFNLKNMERIKIDHYGSLNIHTQISSPDSNPENSLSIIINSYGKSYSQPNFELVTVDNITTITQNHLYDGEVLNEVFSSVICEGMDIEIIIPEDHDPLELFSTSRLLSSDNELKIITSSTFREIAVIIPNGGSKTTIEGVKVLGNLTYFSEGTESTDISGIEILDSLLMNVKSGDLDIKDAVVDRKLFLTHQDNELQMTNITVGLDSRIDRIDGDFHLKNMRGALIDLLIQNGNTYFDTFDFQRIEIESDDNDMEFQNGYCHSDFILDPEHSKVSIDGLQSDWGTLRMTSKYEEIEINNLQRMSLDCESSYTEYKMTLNAGYFGDSQVELRLETEVFGSVEMDDPNDYVDVTKDEDDEVFGVINPIGDEHGYVMRISSTYDSITLNFE